MPKPFISALQLLAAGLLLFTGALAQQPANTPPSSPAKSAAAAPSQPAPAASSSDAALPTQKDKLSYAIGMNVGKGLHRDGVDVDPSIVSRGLQDAMTGGKTLMTDEQAESFIVALQNQLREKAVAQREQEGATNKSQGEAFLAANKSKPGVVVLPSGLQYKVLTAGTGPKPTAGDTVKCNYRGTLVNGTEFDSSEKHGGPATFPVSGVIKGWTEALQLMPVGSKWQLFVPPDLAYGARGADGVIGPDSTLIFEVELLSIEKQK